MKKIQWWHKDLEKKNFLKNIESIIQKEDLTTGNTTKNYEKLISKTLNVKHSIAVSSGSMGTLLAFLALDIGINDEIIIPNIGPKKEPKVSTNAKIPIWLNNGNQKIPIIKPIKAIIIAVFFIFNFVGKKLSNEFWVGI